MAYDSSQDYDLDSQLGFLSPLEANGIDPRQALLNRAGVDRDLDSRALGTAPSQRVTPSAMNPTPSPQGFSGGVIRPVAPAPTVPATVSNDNNPAGGTETATAGDLATMRSRLNDAYKRQQQLESQRESRSTPTDASQYKPTLKRKILRGLAGAGLGFAKGGIVGAGVGAADPDLVGAPGYGDPTSGYYTAEDKRKQGLAETEKELAAAGETGKTALDYGKEMTTAGNTLAERQNQTATQSSVAQKNQAMAEKYKNAIDPASIEQDPTSGKWFGNTYGGERVETGPPKGFKQDPIAQRTADAQRMGLKGEDLKYYVANGSLPAKGFNFNLGGGPKKLSAKDQMRVNAYAKEHDTDPDSLTSEQLNEALGGPPGSNRPAHVKDRQAFESHWNDEFAKARKPFDAERKEVLKQYGIDKDPKAWDDDSTAAVNKIEQEWSKKSAELQQEKDAEAQQYGVYGQQPAATQPRTAPQPAPKAAPQIRAGTKLDPANPAHVALAKSYLEKAGGDKNKARQLARADGYKF